MGRNGLEERMPEMVKVFPSRRAYENMWLRSTEALHAM
jgi:hypothetical protein